MITSSIQCSACDHENSSDVKFCSECGHSLYDTCAKCQDPVLLTQKFCGSCGANLESLQESKRSSLQTWLAQGIDLAKRYQFDRSIELLRKVESQADYRYAEMSSNARLAIDKISAFRSEATESAEKAMDDAKQAFLQDDQYKVVRLLETVPDPLLTDEARQLLAKCKAFHQQVTELRTDIQKALQEKQWSFIGRNVDQLVELTKGNASYQKLAVDVTSKLMKIAAKKFASQDYAGATDELESVPLSCRDDQYNEVFRNVQNVGWLAAQFASEPFATPTLERLAVRFAKEAEDDPEAHQWAKALRTATNAASEDERNAFPSWRASRQSWLGGKVGYFAFPKQIEINDTSMLKKYPGQFAVALGLATQALVGGRFEEQFLEKKGFINTLTKRKKTFAWGIDVGSSGIHAVKLEAIQEKKKGPVGLRLVDTFYLDFEIQKGRIHTEGSSGERIVEGLKKFADEKELKDAELWGNIRGSEMISRFVRLPPVADKKAESMINNEIDQRIPIDREELAIMRKIARFDPNDSSVVGRPATIFAIRKTQVAKRFKLFEAAGIPLDAIQSDPIALANLFAREFASEWTPQEIEDHGDQDGATFDERIKNTIAIIDAGATTTSLMLLSGEAFWCWTIENGGENFLSPIIKATHCVTKEAELLKKSPDKIAYPYEPFALIGSQQDQLRARMKQVIVDAKKQNDRFHVTQTWCVGGTPLTHGWISKVMLRDLA